MPTPSLDDELIQRNETQFFNIPTDPTLLFILKSQEDRERLDSAEGSKPSPLAVLSAIEKETLRKARKVEEVAGAIEERVIEGIKNLMKNPQAPEEPEDEPESSYCNGNNDSGGSDYKSCGDSGEDELAGSDW